MTDLFSAIINMVINHLSYRLVRWFGFKIFGNPAEDGGWYQDETQTDESGGKRRRPSRPTKRLIEGN